MPVDRAVAGPRQDVFGWLHEAGRWLSAVVAAAGYAPWGAAGPTAWGAHVEAEQRFNVGVLFGRRSWHGSLTPAWSMRQHCDDVSLS